MRQGKDHGLEAFQPGGTVSDTMRMRKGLSRGFSLIELLIVVCLVAVLSAIAVVTFYPHGKEARDTEAYTFIEKIRLDQALHFQKHSCYFEDDYESDNYEYFTTPDGDSFSILATHKTTGETVIWPDDL